ncbi:hypothetical protein WJX74_005027 [Apatococcus lobatus]
MTDHADGHLEDLLDEALEDFQDNGAALATSPPGQNTNIPPSAHQPTATAASHEPPQPEPTANGSSSTSESSRKGKGKQGLAFNPLPKRGTARSPGAASHEATANGHGAASHSHKGPFVGGPSIGNQRGIGAIPPDVMSALGQEGLEEGLQQLMAELAQVDLANQQNAAADGEAASSDKRSSSSKHNEAPQGLSGSTRSQGSSSSSSRESKRERTRDVGATLQALAEQTRSLQPDTSPSAGPSGRNQGAGGPMDDELLRQLGAAGLPNLEGLGNGAGPSMEATFADSIMRQLLSKEVLHQPMQDIGARYPQWLADNRSKLSAEDIQRYERQQDYIRKVCHVYDTRPDSFAELLDLMHEMQACGQPPPEIVDELAPGLSLGEDGPFGAGPGGESSSQPPACPVQ